MPIALTIKQTNVEEEHDSGNQGTLIIELVMHMPVHTGSSIANSFLQMIARLGFFNSVVSCKVIELVTILITCAGTTARRSLKFDGKGIGEPILQAIR